MLCIRVSTSVMSVSGQSLLDLFPSWEVSLLGISPVIQSLKRGPLLALLTSLNFSDTTGRKDALNSFTIQKNEDQEEEQNGRTSSKHVGTHKYHRLGVFQLVLNSKCFYH